MINSNIGLIENPNGKKQRKRERGQHTKKGVNRAALRLIDFEKPACNLGP